MSSTPVLHALCQLRGRRLVTIENNREWFAIGERYASDFHQVLYVPDWDAAPIERPWSVALVDHSPDERRRIELERLAPHVDILIAQRRQQALLEASTATTRRFRPSRRA